MKAIIVEDEIRSRQLLESLLKEYCPEIVIVGMAGTVDEAYELIVMHKPGLIFLDIEMQKETGFDLLDKFDSVNFEIIFTTAFEQYALKAIKCCAVDYLLKPIDVEELKVAVARVTDKTNGHYSAEKTAALMRNMRNPDPMQMQLALPSLEGINLVHLADILYLKSDRQYTFFHLKSGERIMTSRNIGEYDKMLPSVYFIRIHHSSIININEVKKYMHTDGGYVLMSNGTQLDISKRKKEDFMRAISGR